MRKDVVEIYSDASNYAVMRHPGRRFPGALIQGDSLHALSQTADRAFVAIKSGKSDEALEEIGELREALAERLNHYKQVLAEHNIGLPFDDRPIA